MPEGPPRLNHVALSLPSEALQPAGRAEIVDFYGDVFGWTEYPQLTEDGRRLVLGLVTYDQFVFLVGDDDPLRAPRTDHFGLDVHTVDDQEVVKIHSFYVHHLLPLTVEVQWWEWPER